MSEPPYTAWFAPQLPVSGSTVVDLALIVCLPPKNVVRIPRWARDSNGYPVLYEFAAPSLEKEEAIVPVIIEIEAPKSDHFLDTYRALRATSNKLSARASSIFSDFEWQQELIAIAAVGLHWWWFRVPRPSPARPNQDSGTEYKQGSPPSSNAVDPPFEHPLNATGTHPVIDIPECTLPDTPFVIGMPGSAEAVSDIKALVDKMVYRDLRTTPEVSDDDDNTGRPSEFLGAFSDVMAMEDTEVDKGAGSDVQ